MTNKFYTKNTVYTLRLYFSYNKNFQQTKITLETFLAWKKRKLKEKEEQAIKDEEKKRNDYKAGRQVGISGREMFYFNPELAAGDGKISLQLTLTFSLFLSLKFL